VRRFVLPAELEGERECVLTGNDHHYLTRVLRLRTGDTFPGVDQRGVEVTCTILADDAESCTVSIGNAGTETMSSDDGMSEPRITLFQAIPKGRKLDQIVRQATECGVASIVPIRTRHCVGEIGDDRIERKIDRLRKIVREAMQQSGNVVEPEICEPLALESLPEEWHQRGTAFVFHQERLDSSAFLDTLSEASREIAICVGPEGGFADDEVALLAHGGFEPVYLGSRVLRSETAALYAIAAIQVAHRLQSWRRHRE